jgi:hypothetical protein
LVTAKKYLIKILYNLAGCFFYGISIENRPLLHTFEGVQFSREIKARILGNESASTVPCDSRIDKITLGEDYKTIS